MAETTLEKTVAEAYAVDPVLCIACDACCQDFPEVFFMGGDDKAHAHDVHPTDIYNPRAVIDVCPTAAITFSGEVPPPLETVELVEVPGWELEWAKWRGAEEDRVERDRRYGRDWSQEEKRGYTRVVSNLPTRVPAVRDRFKYGMPTEMPEYGTHVYMQGKRLMLTGWVKDPTVRSLTHTSSSFPGMFTTGWDLEDQEIVGFDSRHHSNGTLEMIVFHDTQVMNEWKWKAHFITNACTACTICERVCPTNAITSGERFLIDPDLCINCSVCGVYCPFDAIEDNVSVTVQKIKPKQVPKAVVHEELCTGCEFCVDVCPFEALEMKDTVDAGDYSLPQNLTVAVVIDKNCVSCKLCEQVCIKDAIEVPREHDFEDIGMSFMNYLEDAH